MPPKRLLLVDLPDILRDVIGDAVASQGHLQLIGELSADDSVAEAIERFGPCIVILPLNHPEARGQTEALLTNARAGTCIVGLEPDGTGAVLYDLEPRRTVFGVVSPSGLLELIGRC